MDKLLAVFGNPILHSKSPQMFNAAVGKSIFYTRIKVLSGLDLIEAILSLNLKGANVTAPFKEEIVPFIDQLSEEVQIIGGTNTIVNHHGKLKAYNTDWYGATEAIKRSGLQIKGLKVVLLGLGGAGKAVAYGLQREGAEITLINRTLSKAKELALKLNCSYDTLENLPELLKHSQLFVSTILPNSNNQLFGCLPKDIWVFDANYHNSKLIKLAKEQGNNIIDASNWLLYQGELAYKHFFSKTIDIEQMKQGLSTSRKGPIKVVAICHTETPRWLNSELWVTPKIYGLDAINSIHPDLVIYTPDLTSSRIEEIYNDERNKAL